MSILISVLVAFHVLVCLLMVVVVLMQRPKNEGLGAAFGGGMTENIFGAQTTHVLQKFTVWLGIVFFALTLLLAILYAKSSTGETAIQKELMSQPAPVAPAPNPEAAATPGTTETPAAEVAPVVPAETVPAVNEVTTEVSEVAAEPTPAVETPAATEQPAAPAPSPAGN